MSLRALFTIILLFAGVYLAFHVITSRNEQEEASAHTTPLSTALGKEVPLITISHTTKDEPATLTVLNYDTPKILIYSDPVAADRANAYIARFIDDAIGRFRSESKRGNTNASTTIGTLNTFTLSSKVLLATPRIISIAVTESTMLAQIPHPEQYVRYITFDLMQAKALEAKDLFAGNDAMMNTALLLSKQENAKGLSSAAINQALLRDDQHALSRDGLLVSVDKDPDPNTATRSSIEFILPYNAIERYISKDIKEAVRTEQENIRMAEPEPQQ